MKVLVAYDGSLHSKTALKYAINEVRRYGGSLTALHVFESPGFIDCEGGTHAEKRTRIDSVHHSDGARQVLEKEAREIPVNRVWIEGIPDQVIAKYVTDEDVGIVFSTPRFSAVAKKIFCPVFIIDGNKLIAYDNVSSPLWRWENARKAELSGAART